jgi:hypothetical protein
MTIQAFYDTSFGAKTLKTSTEDSLAIASPLAIGNSAHADITPNTDGSDKVLILSCNDDIADLQIALTNVGSVPQNGYYSRKFIASVSNPEEVIYLEGIEKVTITNNSGPGVANVSFKILSVAPVPV